MRSSPAPHLLAAPVGLLLAVATAIGCQSSAPDHADTLVRAASQPTYVAQYGVDTHAYRPSRLNPSVDGSLYVTGMRWTTWDARRAVGKGVAHVNDCKPDCAHGHYARYRVTVHLAKPRELCGSRFFTTLRVKGSGYHTFAHRPGVGCR
ncbi:hypothetical protein [Nocardioides panaciterrulae]|uniref:Uncharacterized protein n=1 Tax=Nocardioides panaciterrulae TaxID=661492 RepID=A0A7Y9J9F6_9ACTN|nr:hypothetical protein [Nocardioides panaciterrulae]NYD40056.1 hypothetical protein [Nocardioides panaciterrulae]